MVQNIDPNLKDQVITICKIEKAMRKKTKELIPVFEALEASQTVTNTQGEKVTKSNPAMQEIRAMFRDYCSIVKVQQDILGSKSALPAETTASLNDMRNKLRIVS